LLVTSSDAPPPTAIYSLSLHDALPIFASSPVSARKRPSMSGSDASQPRMATAVSSAARAPEGTFLGSCCIMGKWLPLFQPNGLRSEEHTSELQSRENRVCRLLLEKKNK